MSIVNRPELGALFSTGDTSKKGCFQLTFPPPSGTIETKGNHSFEIAYTGSPFYLVTNPDLIDLTIPDTHRVKLSLNSPYLVSLSTRTYKSGGVIRQRLKNLVVLAVRKDHLSLFGLRCIRLIKVSGMLCRRLNIMPTACLEILSIARLHRSMYLTSGPLRLLDTCGYTHVRKNREPVMTIRDLNSVERHGPSVIRLRDTGLDGYLLQEKRTAALIVSPKNKLRTIKPSRLW